MNKYLLVFCFLLNTFTFQIDYVETYKKGAYKYMHHRVLISLVG